MSPPQTMLRRPKCPRLAVRGSSNPLARYTDRDAREREIVGLPGAHGSTLVVVSLITENCRSVVTEKCRSPQPAG